MPQLMAIVRHDRGSALVVALSFSIIMAIVGSGLMILSGSAVRHEAAAFENDLAFLTAESGLLLGRRWLADTLNWNTYKDNSMTIIYTGYINGILDTVRLVMGEDGELELQSEATGTGLGFKKRLSWGIQRVVTPNPGVFFNDMDNDQKVVGQGGLNNVWIDGPFHSNTPIQLAAVSNTKADGAAVYFTNGDVSVHNRPEKENFDKGHWGHYGKGGSGNNYNFGIKLKDGQSQNDTTMGMQLDRTFQKKYTPNADSLFMPRIEGQNILLPQNQSATSRAILHYDNTGGIGTATYVYYDAAGVKRDMTFTIDGQVVRIQNAVSVLGVVNGQTTLVTDPGYNIYPVGDLRYADFVKDIEANYADYQNDNNYGVGFVENGNTSILALVSGADIHFEEGYMKAYDAANRSLTDVANKDTVMYLTASLVAIEKGHGIMWDTKKSSGEPMDMDVNSYNFTLRAIGSRTADHFFNYVSAGGTNANEKIRFYTDRRILQNFKAPGVPGFKSASASGERLFLLKTDWREKNIPM